MADLLEPVTVRSGWQWFTTGFVRYRRNPALMIFWVMTYWTLLGLAGLIPVLGDLAVAALAPVLLVGVLAGCRALDQEPGLPTVKVLFSGFGPRFQPLMALGILHFLLTMGVLALTALIDGGVLLQLLARSALGVADASLPDPDSLSPAALLLAVVAYVPVMLAFAYAPLLVAWRGFGLGKSLFFSLVGSWRAWRGLLGLLAAILFFGVFLPTLVMSLLLGAGLNDALVTSVVIVPMLAILAPTIVSAFYTSYGRVIPDTEGAPPAQSV